MIPATDLPSDSSSPLSALYAASSRRGATRREVALPCQAVREHDFKLIADRTLDISIDGLLLPLRSHSTRVLTGETLIVSFSIPGMWIDAEATVARVVHNRRPGDDGLAVGVVFDLLAPSARAALAGFLHGRRAPLPRRGPLARLRRGEEAPRLADEAVMQNRLLPIATPVDVSNDAVDDDSVDGLGVLRAVVGAWQSLNLEH
jgi:PilZ domain